MPVVIEVLLVEALFGQAPLGKELETQMVEILVAVLGTCFAILVAVSGISPGIP
jgi:hypothetical protein